MKRKNIFLMLAFPLCLAFMSCNNDDDNPDTISQTDRNFMTNAAMSNRAEIDAGQMASSKAENTEIRDYGNMMVSDHQTAQNELMSIASQNNGPKADSLDMEHKMLRDQLNTMNGRSFDSLYIHSQVKDHEKAINLFENEAQNGSDQRLKDYANKYLPKLRMHYDKAVNLANQYQ